MLQNGWVSCISNLLCAPSGGRGIVNIHNTTRWGMFQVISFSRRKHLPPNDQCYLSKPPQTGKTPNNTPEHSSSAHLIIHSPPNIPRPRRLS
jgi:hypothetical protein